MPVDFSSNQSGQGSMPTGGLPGTVTPKQASDDAAGLKAMLVDYNKRFMSAAPAKYRDHEVFQVLSQLTMLQKSCSLLVGAPGVGKTKIAEEVARLIATGSPCASALAGYTVYELPLSNLMAGTQFRGQLEERVQKLIEWLETEKVILFIDEIHQLMNGHSGYEGVAQALKPAMARGSIKMIGATTLQESKTLLEDPAFNRRFNRVQVCELSIEQTRDIIETVYLPKMSHHYGCGFANNIATKIVQTAERSKTITSHRPDNAITLLDQVCASTVLQRNYNIATCTDPNLKQHIQSAPCVINATHVESWGKDQTFLVPADFDPVKSKIFFRDNAVDAIYNAIADYVRFDAIFPSGKPFRLNLKGQPKSGRTILLTESAKLIDEDPVYLDLADYSDAPSLNRIIGSPLGYVGSDSKQEMPFDIIESSPRKIIILDNLDKCHPVVHDFFESAMGTGLIKYADNRAIDISKCIILCSEEIQGRSRRIGFVETRDPVSSTEIEIAALDHDEMAAGAGAMVKSMVAVLKAEHQKYASLPDDPGISDDEKKSLAGPEDMAACARRTVLAMI